MTRTGPGCISLHLKRERNHVSNKRSIPRGNGESEIELELEGVTSELPTHP